MTVYKIIIMILLTFVSIIQVPNSFALEKPLKAEDAKIEEVIGIFTLILYGARHSNDIETIAILSGTNIIEVTRANPRKSILTINSKFSHKLGIPFTSSMMSKARIVN